jgi:hypothetical protein
MRSEEKLEEKLHEVTRFESEQGELGRGRELDGLVAERTVKFNRFDGRR